ncbi:MAG: hypothetical protein GY774_21330 [Planctomycetes bacterium]|nr:hypothetical protein [Planctomycetota bacterium]
MAGCHTVTQPSQSAWQYTYAYLDYYQLEFLKNAAQETYNSIAVIPEYKAGLFTGQLPNDIVRQIENANKQTLDNIWQNRVNAYQAAFSKVQIKPLYTMLDMLEKHKLQQLQRANTEKPAISIGRLLNTDLVVLVSFQGLHFSVNNPITGTVKITHDAIVHERIYRTKDGQVLSDTSINLNNAEKQPLYLNRVLRGIVLCAFENKLYDGLKELKKSVEEQPDNWIPYVLIVSFAEEAGDYFLMDETAEEMIRIDSTHHAGYLAKARAKKHLKDWENAFQFYVSAAEKTKRPYVLNMILKELEDLAKQAHNEELDTQLANIKLKYNRIR